MDMERDKWNDVQSVKWAACRARASLQFLFTIRLSLGGHESRMLNNVRVYVFRSFARSFSLSLSLARALALNVFGKSGESTTCLCLLCLRWCSRALSTIQLLVALLLPHFSLIRCTYHLITLVCSYNLLLICVYCGVRISPPCKCVRAICTAECALCDWIVASCGMGYRSPCTDTYYTYARTEALILCAILRAYCVHVETARKLLNYDCK